jgi:5-methylcytosine-specific restriction protein B
VSRFHPKRNIEPILAAAERWKNEALLGGGSILSNERLWTSENLEGLQKYYVENLDEGDGNFITKLEGQLAGASPQVKKLAAELTWFMLLCPSNIGPANKRDNIKLIWEWSGSQLPESDMLVDEVLLGIGSGGTAFNTQRWRELVFFITLLRSLFSLEPANKQELLDDGWKFAEWLATIEGSESRQLRHMLLYLIFPDQFERIFGGSDRRKLLVAFTELSPAQVRQMSALEQCKKIAEIRAVQEQKHETNELDFYAPPLGELWMDSRKSVPKREKAQSYLSQMCEGLTRKHVLDVLEAIDQNSYPSTAKSSTYDLIYGPNRYPPKFVLAQAVEAMNGTELSRSTFTGGQDSEAFKILRSLGFAIEPKDKISLLLSKFIEQANEGTSLVVREYSKEYRGLSVKVSFGQGAFSRVPWISYTGYGQSTADGIYPVILYYKSVGTLIVSYGVSETNKPDVEWNDAAQLQRIDDFFSSKFGDKPERYGSSYVHEAFDLSEEVNIAAIQMALDAVVGKFHAQFESESDQTSDLPSTVSETYAVEDAIKDLFIDETQFIEILELLNEKKNLILQGAPGVGKTYASKRLAYTLIGEKAPERVGMVQFHQSYSYEDFVQGFRPSGEGFRLRNGVFYDFCETAKNDPGNDYVFIIDELNRGNLSKIFGELMLLIEADKRGPDWAIPLTYAESDSPKFYVPENLYLLGLMNTADRSLAMVDYALRRRFGFATLKPGFETDQFYEYMVEHKAPKALIQQIVDGMTTLNNEIAGDTVNLGPGFCIGHSFFCSLPDDFVPDERWFERVVRSEIEPLLREYYFDASEKAEELTQRLLGF